MPDAPNHQVVIVEDNVATNNLLRDWLKLTFRVICFLDAESTLRLLAGSSDPTVFIIDYNLPGDNGILLKQKIAPKFPAGKYILISGLFDENLTRQAKENGFDALIPKPFTMPALSQRVRELLALPSDKTNLVDLVKKTPPTS